jgi:hypothetical protein
MSNNIKVKISNPRSISDPSYLSVWSSKEQVPRTRFSLTTSLNCGSIATPNDKNIFGRKYFDGIGELKGENVGNFYFFIFKDISYMMFILFYTES